VNDLAVRWVRGSLSTPQSLERLLRGVEAVVHCAGAVRGASADDFNQVNVDGVARLVQAVQEVHPMPRFLLISSLAARQPDASWYASSKRQGEEALRLKAGCMHWTVLRPPVVYGPGDRETLPLLNWMRRGIAPVFGDGSSRFSMLFAEDLAEAVLCLLNRPDWIPRPFELHDGRPQGYNWLEVIGTLSQVMGRPVHALKIPLPLLRAAASGNLILARLLGYSPMLTPSKVGEFVHSDWVCDDAALRRATGWAPRIGLEEGMRRMMEFLQENP
jgi:nucleoside-diphosphate-sugar epimerase